MFPYKWPFALDLLYRQYQVNKTQRLLAFQTQFFDKLGPTIEFRLFGDVGFFTFDPKNVEAILSTNFEGMAPEVFGLPALWMIDGTPRLRAWLQE